MSLFFQTDVNECEETNGGCEALCCNTIGSFYCRCPVGQKLNEDAKTCQGQLPFSLLCR
uniref:EGF-like calcium-binding domain-containing protein n=1 Tax=Oryzias melastigma TaxID=30732 RepID=A0A3B3CNB0_ORYME